MNQYTPMEVIEEYPNLNRKITDEEYDDAIDYACSLGVKWLLFRKEKLRSEFYSDF